MIEFEYINPLKQHGKISFDLILTNPEDSSFYSRTGMVFLESVSEEEKIVAAELAIQRLLEERQVNGDTV